tara:strand:+ start:734 stop:1096 length:363 start_codon:yes stop_codon:yes gene_type:complete
MKKVEISYKDLTKSQLEFLKERYINSRISSMSQDDLQDFVRTIISDQILGTVGNLEEREAWNEMKDHFKDNFKDMIKESLKVSNNGDVDIDQDKQELEKRLDLVEKRKKEKASTANEDMW